MEELAAKDVDTMTAGEAVKAGVRGTRGVWRKTDEGACPHGGRLLVPTPCHLAASWGREDLGPSRRQMWYRKPLSVGGSQGLSGAGGCALLEEGSQLRFTRERARARGLGWRRPGLEAVGHCWRLAGSV